MGVCHVIGREYCTCKFEKGETVEVYIDDDDEWGWWDVCCKCGKEIEGTYTPFNHFDGEDHDDPDG